MHIICADLGGTNSRFACFTLENQGVILRSQHICPTSTLKNTHDVLAAIEHMDIALDARHMYCFGMAGPVEENGLCASLTNAPLHVDFQHVPWVRQGKNFLLVNDFALQAYASFAPNVTCSLILPAQENQDSIQKKAVRGILGAGTGLGTAALIPAKSGGYSIMQAEGGHADFPFLYAAEQDFAQFAMKQLQQSRLSAEDILSARGVSLMYAYVHNVSVNPKEAAAAFNDATSPVLELYARFLGRFCRHWALNTLCFGGLYLGGGVLMKNPAIVHSGYFSQEFYACPSVMYAILQKVPVLLMQHEFAGLWGAAYLAKMHLPYA